MCVCFSEEQPFFRSLPQREREKETEDDYKQVTLLSNEMIDDRRSPALLVRCDDPLFELLAQHPLPLFFLSLTHTRVTRVTGPTEVEGVERERRRSGTSLPELGQQHGGWETQKEDSQQPKQA